MKSRNIPLCATFVGTIIGAGFASGREISLYFGHTSLLAPIISGIVLTFLCFVFMELGRFNEGNILRIFGKFEPLIKLFLYISAFISLLAMVSGGGEVILNLTRLRHGDIFTAVIVLVTIILGVDKIKLCNTIFVPLIIVMIILITALNGRFSPFERTGLISSVTYSGMNIIMGGYFLSRLSVNCSRKDNLKVSVISGAVITALLLCIYCSIQNTLDDSMPLISAAKKVNIGVVGNLIMYLAVYTTAVSDLYVISLDNKKTAIIITAVILPLATLPFSSIVDFTYPILGVIGSVISLYCVVDYYLIGRYVKHLYVIKA